MPKNVEEPDLVIIGGGPAGLASAIYSARGKVDAVLVEGEVVGGQVRGCYSVENYPGFDGREGLRLAALIEAQALALGARIEEFEAVERVSLSKDEKVVETTGRIFKPKAVIIATGASPKKLPIPREKEYAGKGVHYCAICDGAMYEGKAIAVVGGGSSALLEALYLTGFASRVYIIRRKDFFHGERALIEEVEKNPKIEVLYNKDLMEVGGSPVVQEALLRDTVTGGIEKLRIDAVFGYIGNDPRTRLFAGDIRLDDWGYIVTDGDMATNVPGVYAAGDVRAKRYRQITTAVADGTIAALDAQRYLMEVKSGVRHG